jgi:hypothetical protein
MFVLAPSFPASSLNPEPFKIAEFVAYDSRVRCRSLERVGREAAKENEIRFGLRLL